MIDSYLENPSKTNYGKIREILLTDDISLKINIIHKIASNSCTEFVPLLIEIMLSEDNSSLRATIFWALTILGKNEIVSDLIIAFQEETDNEAKISMKDSLEGFLLSHNIPISSIKLEGEIQEVTGNIVKEELLSTENIAKDMVVETPKDLNSTPQNRLNTILLELTPNIPITLERLSQLTGEPVKVLEKTLIELSKSTNSGVYYPLEQVFMKQLRTVERILDRKQISRKPACFDCGAVSLQFPCESCGQGLQCSICKLMIGDTEDLGRCSACKSAGHNKHLLEWGRIKNTCPICKEKLIIV